MVRSGSLRARRDGAGCSPAVRGCARWSPVLRAIRGGRERLGEVLTYLRAHGLRAVARKLRQLYVYDRQRVYITRSDLDGAASRSSGRTGVDVHLVRADDVSRFKAFPRLSERTVRAWLHADHHVLLASKDGVPAGYRWLSRRVPPAMAPVVTLQPDELFSMMSFVAPSFRRQGIHTALKTATESLLMPLGYRRVWGSQSPLNHVVHEVTYRPTNVTRYVGTLTRHSLLGHVRFSFVPTTHLSPERIVGAVDVLTAALGRLRRVGILANRVSVDVEPGALERLGASLQMGLGLTTVRETVRQAEELRESFDRIVGDEPDALIVLYDPMLLEHRRTLVDLATARRLPALYEGAEFAAAGGLFACSGPAPALGTLPDALRRVVVARDPAQLVINLTTARRLGVTLPHALLERADRVLA